jgi:hypothetical protein
MDILDILIIHGGRCAAGQGRQLEAVRKGGRGAREKFSLISQSEMLRVQAFLADGNSSFHSRHLFFRKSPDWMLKLFRKHINHSRFAVQKIDCLVSQVLGYKCKSKDI